MERLTNTKERKQNKNIIVICAEKEILVKIFLEGIRAKESITCYASGKRSETKAELLPASDQKQKAAELLKSIRHKTI